MLDAHQRTHSKHERQEIPTRARWALYSYRPKRASADTGDLPTSVQAEGAAIVTLWRAD